VSQNQSSRKGWQKTALKLLIVAVVLWAVRSTIATALDELSQGRFEWNIDPLWLLAAAALYLLGLLPAGMFWHRVLLVMGQDARLTETLRAYYIGHLGKYVPGKAMVVVIRAGLIRSHRVNTSVAAVSVFFETLTMMAVGAFISAAILVYRETAAGFRDQSLLFWLAVALMIAAGMPTVPPIFKRLVRLAGVGKSDPSTAEKLDKLGYRTLAFGWICMTLVWGLLGLSLWAVLNAMGVADAHPLGQLHLYTAGVSLAMVAGFLSLIPGGLGVRDVILVRLIERLFVVAAAQAAVAGVLLRLIWLLSELLISIILYIGGERAPKTLPPDNRQSTV